MSTLRVRRSIHTRSSVTVRPARMKDSARIAELSCELGYPVSAKRMRDCMTTVLKRSAQKMFVADVDGIVEGWVEVFLPHSVLNWGKAEVGALIVGSKTRGHGLGQALLDAARRWSEQRKSQFVYLRSNIKRKDAHRFYKRAGYKIHKTQFVFQLVLDKKRKG